MRLIARERGWLRAGANELRKRGVADAAVARFFKVDGMPPPSSIEHAVCHPHFNGWLGDSVAMASPLRQ